jgi:hypothetical protein
VARTTTTGVTTTSLVPTATTTTTPRSLKPGYRLVRANGTITDFGPPSLGDLSKVKLDRPIVAAVATRGTDGYWLVASDGGVFNFGAANFYGSAGAVRLDRPIVGVAATADGGGYWLVSSDGGIFAYGDARFYGSTGGRDLNKPIVGMASTPDGEGYWLVASDGGIFAFGDARFFGSTGSLRLNKPIVAMAATPDGRGYWLVASDGGIFAYGDARYHGSTGSRKLRSPIVAMAVTRDGEGYWLAERDGTVFPFGDAPALGSALAASSSSAVVAILPALSTSIAPPPPPPATTTTTVPRTTTTVARTTTTVARTTTTVARTTTTVARTTTTVARTTTTVPRTTTTTVPTTTTTTPGTSPAHPYAAGHTGYDVSWPQCVKKGSARVKTLPGDPSFAIVGTNNGTISGFNSCFAAEAAWAGTNLSVYIILQPAPGGTPVPYEATGPDGFCAATSSECEGYDWGYNYAEDDIAYVRAQGRNPKIWWLDIETAEKWPTAKLFQPVNAAIIQGALAAIKAAGDVGGIYCTWYQWGEITGSYLPQGGPPIWVPGADTVSGNNLSAKSYCQRALLPGDPSLLSSRSIGFAGGAPWLVQYGYGASVRGSVDPDYSCG